jgi:hypothetical protein
MIFKRLPCTKRSIYLVYSDHCHTYLHIGICSLSSNTFMCWYFVIIPILFHVGFAASVAVYKKGKIFNVFLDILWKVKDLY